MRYYTLDAIRGIGAISVLLFHMGLVWHIAPYGYLAVDVFFALSGFVMAMTYERDLKFGMTVGQFYTLRLERLYPTYLIGLGLGTIVIAAKVSAGTDWPSPWILFNVAMLPAPVTGDFFPVNVPAWSLFFELIAYACFAVAIRVRSSTLVLVMVVSACVLVTHGGIRNVGSTWTEFPLGLARLGLAFPLGWLLWRWNVRPWELPAALHRPAKFLGDMSYPLYVIHYPLLSPLQLLLGRYHLAGPLPAIAIVVLLVVVAGFLAHLMSRRAEHLQEQDDGHKEAVATHPDLDDVVQRLRRAQSGRPPNRRRRERRPRQCRQWRRS